MLTTSSLLSGLSAVRDRREPHTHAGDSALLAGLSAVRDRRVTHTHAGDRALPAGPAAAKLDAEPLEDGIKSLQRRRPSAARLPECQPGPAAAHTRRRPPPPDVQPRHDVDTNDKQTPGQPRHDVDTNDKQTPGQPKLGPPTISGRFSINPTKMMAGRRLKEERNKNSKLKREYNALARAWNTLHGLRRGETVPVFAAELEDRQAEKRAVHKNRWLFTGTMRVAYRSLGARDHSAANGELGETRRGGECLSCHSVIATLVQRQAFAAAVGQPCALVADLCSDATPRLLNFGALSPVVAPHARYLERNANNNGWDHLLSILHGTPVQLHATASLRSLGTRRVCGG